MSAKSYYKRYARIGPGGWKCRCCTPAPKGKKMCVFFKLWKHREKRECLQFELIED